MDDVQTSAFTRPSLKESSASILASFDSEPWCTAIGSPSRLNRAPMASADCRVFTNISVDLLFLMIEIISLTWEAMSGSVRSLRDICLSASTTSGMFT